VETEAEKARVQAEWEALRGCGHGRGRGRGRGWGRGGGTGGTTATAWDSDADDAEEQISDADPTLTDDDNIPNVQMTTTRPEPRLPHTCRANAPRFFPDDVEEVDITPQVVHPRPKPRPIAAHTSIPSVVVL